MSEAGPNRKIFNMYFTQWWSVVNTLSQLNELEVILDLNYFKSCLLNEIFMQNDSKMWIFDKNDQSCQHKL